MASAWTEVALQLQRLGTLIEVFTRADAERSEQQLKQNAERSDQHSRALEAMRIDIQQKLDRLRDSIEALSAVQERSASAVELHGSRLEDVSRQVIGPPALAVVVSDRIRSDLGDIKADLQTARMRSSSSEFVVEPRADPSGKIATEPVVIIAPQTHSAQQLSATPLPPPVVKEVKEDTKKEKTTGQQIDTLVEAGGGLIKKVPKPVWDWVWKIVTWLVFIAFGGMGNCALQDWLKQRSLEQPPEISTPDLLLGAEKTDKPAEKPTERKPPTPPAPPPPRDRRRLKGRDSDATAPLRTQAEDWRAFDCQPNGRPPDPFLCPREAEKARERGWVGEWQ